MSDRALRLVVAVLAAAGGAVASYMTYARFTDTGLVCSTGGCETVQSSRYATVGGVPVPVLGLVAYLAILTTVFSTSEVARAAAAAVALAGLTFSVYLLYVQVALIDAVCQWCLANDAVITLLAIAATVRLVGARELRGSARRRGCGAARADRGARDGSTRTPDATPRGHRRRLRPSRDARRGSRSGPHGWRGHLRRRWSAR